MKMAERLSVDYGKKPKFSYTVYTSPKVSNTTLEYYNTVLSTHGLLEHFDVCAMLDNEQLNKVAEA